MMPTNGIANAGEQARGGEGQQQQEQHQQQEEGEEKQLFRFHCQSYTPQMFMNDLKKRPKKILHDCPRWMHDDYDDRVRSYPLHQAVASGRIDIMQLLLDKGYHIHALNEDGRTPLHEAASGTAVSSVATTEALLAAGADVDFRCRRKDMSALDIAASEANVSAAKVLIEHGANVNAAGAGGTPLHHAAFGWGPEKMALFLLANGAAVDARDAGGGTPLQCAVLSDAKAMAQALLAAGADVTIKRKDGKSALDRAAGKRSGDLARVIIEHGVEHGVDVNGQGAAGRTPLHVAAHFNMAEVVGLLVEAGADIDREDNRGNTPLHIALRRSGFAAAVALLNLGASVMKQNVKGYSPLHFAAVVAGPIGTKKIIDLLLRKGADEKAVANDGKTAADVVGVQFRQQWNKPEAEDVCKLLADAPVDRAWRRRGFLVLCRAHYPGGRVQLRQGLTCANDGVAQRTRSHAKPSRRAEAEWAGVVGMLMRAGADPISWMGDGADCIFKMIVGYL